MIKSENKDTRYYIDLDIKNMKIIRWDYDDRNTLIKGKFSSPYLKRIYITKGQYNKLLINEANK